MFIGESVEKTYGGLNDFCPKIPLSIQASEITNGNLGERCKPPIEIHGRSSGETCKLMSPRCQQVSFQDS